MTREERAKAYADMISAEYPYGIPTLHSEVRQAYLQGAEDTYTNPEWRMCEEELPDKPCECVCHDGERMFFARWVDDTPQGLSGWSINGLTAQPIAWLPLPRFKV